MVSAVKYNGDGSTRVFPVSFKILGEDYVRVFVDSTPINDRTLYDIINNSIIFNSDNIPPIGENNVEIMVATNASELGDLPGALSSIDIVASNIDKISLVANNITTIQSSGDGIYIVNALPLTATEGEVVYLSTDKKLYYYNGTTWQAVGSGSGTTPTTDVTGLVLITGYHASGEPMILIQDNPNNQALHVSFVTDNTDAVDGGGVYYLTTIVNAFLEYAERNPYLSGTYYWLNRAISEGLSAEVLRSLIYDTMQTTEYVFNSSWQTWATLTEISSPAGETVSISGYVNGVPTFVLSNGTNATQTMRDYINTHKNDLSPENKLYLELIIAMFNRFVDRNPEITGAYFWLQNAIANSWSELTLATAIYQAVLSTLANASEVNGGGALIPNTNAQFEVDGAPVIIIGYASDNEPIVSIAEHINNNEEDKQYVLDNTHLKSPDGHFYETVIIIAYNNFFGRNPECNGCAFWLRVCVANQWTKLQVENNIYQAGLAHVTQSNTDISDNIIVSERPSNPTAGTVVLDVVNGEISVWDGLDWVIQPYIPPVGAATITSVDVLPALDDPLFVEGSMIYLTTNQKMYVKLNGAWTPYFEELAMDGSSLNNIGVVSGLPITGLPNQTVFNTIDNKLYKYTNGTWTEVVQAVDVAQSVASGSITTAAFAQGLTGVEIVATLPTTANFRGRMAFLTTDNKLYTYNGTAWVAAIGSSVTLGANSITAGMIAANAVTAGTIAAGAITATEIAAGSISSSRIAAGAITANQIAANAISATHISAGAVTASAIAANAITVGHISAGAVTATKLAAGSVTADKIGANTINAGHIASGSIEADKLAANSVTANSISSGTITAGKIVANDIAVTSTYTIQGSAVAAVTGSVVAITSTNSAAVGSFTVTNTNAVAMKIMVVGTGRSGVAASDGIWTGYSQTFGVFVGTTKVYDYGWTPMGEDAKNCTFTYTVPANSSVTFTLRAARNIAGNITAHSYMMNFSIFGVRN